MDNGISAFVNNNHATENNKIETRRGDGRERDMVAATKTSGSAMAEGPRDALVSRNSANTKHPI